MSLQGRKGCHHLTHSRPCPEFALTTPRFHHQYICHCLYAGLLAGHWGVPINGKVKPPISKLWKDWVWNCHKTTDCRFLSSLFLLKAWKYGILSDSSFFISCAHPDDFWGKKIKGKRKMEERKQNRCFSWWKMNHSGFNNQIWKQDCREEDATPISSSGEFRLSQWEKIVE